jgi:hypothetical protein
MCHSPNPDPNPNPNPNPNHTTEGNNGKWQATSMTGFETRGNFHYRSGLNAIPLLEWYRLNPDDVFLIEPALGAIAG